MSEYDKHYKFTITGFINIDSEDNANIVEYISGIGNDNHDKGYELLDWAVVDTVDYSLEETNEFNLLQAARLEKKAKELQEQASLLRSGVKPVPQAKFHESPEPHLTGFNLGSL